MYSLLSGCLPFFGKTPFEIFDKIRTARVVFDIKEFLTISSQAKDLISKLLAKDIKDRYTCAQALKHEWF